jgi:L-rhamnose mutarotase
MIRKTFVMQLRPGQIEEYRRRHQPIWPDLEKTLIDHGVLNYSIHLHPETLQLFAYAEIESEERWSAIAETAVCRKWWAFMRDLMETREDQSPASVDLIELFHIQKS